MLKNALLSIKKSIGKSLLLLVLMGLIANLVIAGLSIKSGTSKSMEQVRSSLGSDVTFSYNMQNMMKNRGKGEAMDQVMNNITLDMANQLKDLKYVEDYNYTLSVGATSDQIEPVEMSKSEDGQDQGNKGFPGGNFEQPRTMDQNDFTVVGNTTMAHIENFTNENYVLTSGRLLTTEDANTNACVIESNLASDNGLAVGDEIKVSSLQSGDEKEATLKIVGIFEVQTSHEMGGMMSNRQNPMNQIYVDLSIAQTLNNDENSIMSAIYYLDDPEHIEAFQELAKETDIDFETYTLDVDDRVYQNSISSLENMEQFASIFLWVVVGAGCAILCLILVLTMRNRFYEFGVFLSLGQPKLKIVLQQFIEVFMIAIVAFTLSLGTGKMVSNVVSSMLQSSQDNRSEMRMKMPEGEEKIENFDPQKEAPQNLFDRAMQPPTQSELDVSLTGNTIVQLVGMGVLICFVSVVVPSIYILRLSPREILVKKEG